MITNIQLLSKLMEAIVNSLFPTGASITSISNHQSHISQLDHNHFLQTFNYHYQQPSGISTIATYIPKTNNDSSKTLSIFTYKIITRANLSPNTVYLAIHYLIKYKKQLNLKATNMSSYGLILISLVLATKYMDDFAYKNTIWAYLSDGIFDAETVNKMELEFLFGIEFCLFVHKEKFLELVGRLSGVRFLRMHGSLNNYYNQKNVENIPVDLKPRIIIRSLILGDVIYLDTFYKSIPVMTVADYPTTVYSNNNMKVTYDHRMATPYMFEKNNENANLGRSQCLVGKNYEYNPNLQTCRQLSQNNSYNYQQSYQKSQPLTVKNNNSQNCYYNL